VSPKKKKQPVLGAKVQPKKQPKRGVAGKPNSKDPTVIWGFSFVDLGGPWGWSKIEPKVLGHVLGFFHNLEALRPSEVFGSRHKRVEPDALCPEAKRRLGEIELDDLDCLWELRVSGLERIWGHRDGHVFYPIWWDPLHEVCPSKKKHT
jgi:hypothetical protein